MLWILKSLHSQIYISITTGLNYSTRVQNTSSNYRKVLVLKTSHYCYCIGIQNIHTLGLPRFLKRFPLQKHWLEFYLQGVDLNFSTFIQSFLKKTKKSPCSGILKHQKSENVLLVLTCFINHTQFSWACPLHFRTKNQVIAFYLRTNTRFWFLKKFFRSKLESWWTKSGKVLLVLRNLDIPTCSYQELHVWNLYQGLNSQFYS